VDRVDLTWQFGIDRRRRWRNSASQSWGLTYVSFGRLADGRWYAARSRDPDGAYVFADDGQGEELALRTAKRLMADAGGSWIATPAAFDHRGNPTDGLPWVASGGEWTLGGGP
jgi:hypothetical protein